MGRLLLRLVTVSLALWLVTLILAPHVEVISWSSPDDTWAYIVTLVLVAFVFGLVNAIVGNFIRIVAFPLYILTLGLISLVVNGLLLLLVAWIGSLVGYGLVIESFGWGVLGALLLSVISWFVGILLRPLTRSGTR